MFLVDWFNIAIASPRISTIVGLVLGAIIGWNVKANMKDRNNPIVTFDLNDEEAKDLVMYAARLRLSRGAQEEFERHISVSHPNL